MAGHWVALRLGVGDADAAPCEASAIATWALHFGPRVALLEESVVLEVAQSLRLFGGEDRVHEAVATGAQEIGVSSLAWAPTALAALALARCGVENGFARPIDKLLDALPLAALTAVGKHEPTLARLGCRTLADVRRLPRGGLSRRFEKNMLNALDQAYGLAPEVFQWESIPETFAVRLELPGRVETAPGLLFGARRLLLQMGGWPKPTFMTVTSCSPCTRNHLRERIWLIPGQRQQPLRRRPSGAFGSAAQHASARRVRRVIRF